MLISFCISADPLRRERTVLTTPTTETLPEGWGVFEGGNPYRRSTPTPKGQMAAEGRRRLQKAAEGRRRLSDTGPVE